MHGRRGEAGLNHSAALVRLRPRFQDVATKEMYDTWVRNNPSSGGDGR